MRVMKVLARIISAVILTSPLWGSFIAIWCEEGLGNAFTFIGILTAAIAMIVGAIKLLIWSTE